MSLLTPQVEPVLLYQGDDESELLNLRLALEVAARNAAEADGQPSYIGDELPSAKVTAARDAYLAKLREAADRALEVGVSPIGSARFAALAGEHQPRDAEKHPGDAEYGVNRETFPRALLLFRDERKRTIVSPDLTEGELQEFIDDDCSTGHIAKLFESAYWLNRSQGSALPKGLESLIDSPRSDDS